MNFLRSTTTRHPHWQTQLTRWLSSDRPASFLKVPIAHRCAYPSTIYLKRTPTCMGPETTTSYGDGQRRGGVKWHRGANRAPRCIIHNDCQLQLPIARAASQLYSSAITAIGAALATAGLTLAGVSAAGSTAVSAIADGATTVVEADRCSRQRNGSNRRPKKKTFHHRVSISRESESKEAMPQHTAQANNPLLPCTTARRWSASSVPPHTENDAGRPIWNGLACREHNAIQLARRRRRIFDC
jgi:hypothetical protein